MKTPYFLISKEKLDNNINDFLIAFEKNCPNSILSYSVKTNSLPWILKYLNEKGAFAEVVSDEEYYLALNCGYSDNNIVFNGPIKGEECFKRAVENGAYVNLDSKKDLEYLTQYICKNTDRIGIRINIPSDLFDDNDIGYESDGFRFGFADATGELEEAINVVKKVCGDRFGIHLHCNSVTRSINVYETIADYAVEIIKKYSIYPSFIDIGGGFFGGVENKPKPNDYLKAVSRVLSETVSVPNVKLIVEPGSAIIGSAVDLHTSVLDVKNTDKARIVTTDGSRIYIDPLWKKTGYMFTCDSAKKEKEKQIICGYTCMDHDRIMSINNKPELSVGDSIVYHRVGAYTMTFGGMFIRYYPEVYVKTGTEILKVRDRANTDQYIKLHS
jgi:diaminopimelate decarboxylase